MLFSPRPHRSTSTITRDDKSWTWSKETKVDVVTLTGLATLPASQYIFTTVLPPGILIPLPVSTSAPALSEPIAEQ